MAPFAPPTTSNYRPYTKKGLPRKRPGPAPKPKHELAKWKNKKPLQRVERSYPLERKIEVLMFLLNHRITETEPPQRAPRRRLGQPPECEASYTITEDGRKLYHRAPTYAEASAWYKVPMPTIHGWWDNREKILEGTGVKLPPTPETLPVPDWLNKPLEKDGPQYQTNTTSPSNNRAGSIASSSSSLQSSPAPQSAPPAQQNAPAQNSTPAAQRAPPPPPRQTNTPSTQQPTQTPAPNTATRPQINASTGMVPTYGPSPLPKPPQPRPQPPSQQPAPVQIVFSLKAGGVGLPKSYPAQQQQPQVQQEGPPYIQMAPPPPGAGLIPPLDLPTIPWTVYAPPPGISLAPIPPPAPAPVPQHVNMFGGQMRQVRAAPIKGVVSKSGNPTSTPSTSTPGQSAQPTKQVPAPAQAPVAPVVNNNPNADRMEVDGAEQSSSSASANANKTQEVTMSN